MLQNDSTFNSYIRMITPIIEESIDTIPVSSQEEKLARGKLKPLIIRTAFLKKNNVNPDDILEFYHKYLDVYDDDIIQLVDQISEEINQCYRLISH